MAKILYSDYYLPNKRVDLKETVKANETIPLPEGYTTKDDFCEDFAEESKLKEIAVENEKDVVQIFNSLLSKFFAEFPISPFKIKYIFYTNPLNNYLANGASVPYYLQAKFRMEQAAVLIIDQKCATSLFALEVARALLQKDNNSCALILSPCFLKKMDERFIQFTVCGDAAGIMLVKAGDHQEGFEIIDFLSLSDGSFSLNRYETSPGEWDGHAGSVNDRIKIIEKGIGVINDLLAANGLDTGDLKLLIPQSVNYYAYYIYSRLLKIPIEKVFTDNIPFGGHLGDVDTVRNFTDVKRNRNFKEGDNVLLYGLGSDGTDLNYNALLLRYSRLS